MSKRSLTQTLIEVSGDLGNVEESSSGSSVSKHEDEVGEEQKSEKLKIGTGSSKVHIDREEYLQAFRDLTYEKNNLLVKNNILHRQIAEYYKKKKLDNALKPMEFSLDLEEKYQLKLFAYEEIKENGERETESTRLKLEEVTKQYESEEEAALVKFKALQDHEKSTGYGLIYAKNGKTISDKTVHRFLSLQKSKMETASAMMLRFIRVKNAVTEQENVIRELEKVGPGLYVAAYQELRVDHQNFTSKLEGKMRLLDICVHTMLRMEREDDLIKNRNKCTVQLQMLAHVREKMDHTEQVINTTECDYGDAEILYQKAREELNIVKTRRDRLRIATEVEYWKSGLLTKKMLLRDFQDAMDTVEKLREKKANLEQQIAKNNMEFRKVRTCIKFQGNDDDTDDNKSLAI